MEMTQGESTGHETCDLSLVAVLNKTLVPAEVDCWRINPSLQSSSASQDKAAWLEDWRQDLKEEWANGRLRMSLEFKRFLLLVKVQSKALAEGKKKKSYITRWERSPAWIPNQPNPQIAQKFSPGFTETLAVWVSAWDNPSNMDFTKAYLTVHPRCSKKTKSSSTQ